jgi:NhaC family Na+:H+ antiporter
LFYRYLICAVISLATGTSGGTVGTVGLALIGIDEGLGIPLYLTAGAVVSGAFFGDKMSPLSDTTNLAPAVCGTDLCSHIRGMIATTGPAMLVALCCCLNLNVTHDVEEGQVNPSCLGNVVLVR